MSGSALATSGPITDEQMTAIDAVVQQCSPLATAQQGIMKRAFSLARGIEQLREMITDEMMEAIVPLMNTSLGFKTDRDPKQIDRKTGKPFEPYPVEVVKECLIESLIRGLYPVGNEWNIIAANSYATKNAYTRLIREYPGMSNFKFNLAVPVAASGKTTVGCTATWKLNGNEDSIERVFEIKVNEYMSADAITGKAERKLRHAVYGQVTGSEHLLPEGDVADIVQTRTVTSREVDASSNDRLEAAGRQQEARSESGRSSAAIPPAGATASSAAAKDDQKKDGKGEGPFGDLSDVNHFIKSMTAHAPQGVAGPAIMATLQTAAKNSKHRLTETSVEWRTAHVEAAMDGRFDWKLAVIKG